MHLNNYIGGNTMKLFLDVLVWILLLITCTSVLLHNEFVNPLIVLLLLIIVLLGLRTFLKE